MDTGFLDKQQLLFLDFVKQKHEGQVRKYTGEPYWHHLVSVAKLLHKVQLKHLAVTALAHDLYEDTDCTHQELFDAIISCGYVSDFAVRVHMEVTELTDVYTKESFPTLNRQTRKGLESTRIGSISIASQNVKLADMCDNSESILFHDESFAKVYLKEKEEVLAHINHYRVNPYLYRLCSAIIKKP